jgi:hypothetical protein
MRPSTSARTARLSAPSAGRRANGRRARPLGSSAGVAGSCGTLTSCTFTDSASSASRWRTQAARWDSRITRRTRLRTGDEGTSFLGMAIISRGVAASVVRRAPTTKCAPTSRTGRLAPADAVGTTRAPSAAARPGASADPATAPGEPSMGTRASAQAGRSDAQALAALGATRTDDCAATAGLHPHQEAMGALAANHRRLIRAFHDGLFLKKPAITSSSGRPVNLGPAPLPGRGRVAAGPHTPVRRQRGRAFSLWIR